MGQIERNPKTTTIVLQAGVIEQANKLMAERDDSYARFTKARDSLASLYQLMAGKDNDWELDAEGTTLLVTKKMRA